MIAHPNSPRATAFNLDAVMTWFPKTILLLFCYMQLDLYLQGHFTLVKLWIHAQDIWNECKIDEIDFMLWSSICDKKERKIIQSLLSCGFIAWSALYIKNTKQRQSECYKKLKNSLSKKKKKTLISAYFSCPSPQFNFLLLLVLRQICSKRCNAKQKIHRPVSRNKAI